MIDEFDICCLYDIIFVPSVKYTLKIDDCVVSKKIKQTVTLKNVQVQGNTFSRKAVSKQTMDISEEIVFVENFSFEICMIVNN